MEKVFVIAQYNEDISWKPENSVVIKKGVDMPNTGRESSSYAYYIKENYENLPENVIFLQGDPFAHTDKIDATTSHFEPLGAIYESNHNGEPHHPGLRIKQLAEALEIEIPETLEFVVGAQFCVHKDIIRKKPKEFYEKLYSLANTYQEAPWVLERLWKYIFT